MLRGLDHVVILVPDLDEAVESYTRLGFTVVPGGRHNVATENALIAFEDGSYLELIAFWEDAPQHRWHRYLRLGGGLVDYCMRTSDLANDVAQLRAAGIAMSEKEPMSRLRPDGYRVEWALSLATETQGVTPFLIEDITPREERVPRQVEHANGVTGISTITIAVRDLDVARRVASVLGDAPPVEAGDMPQRGARYMSGGHALEFILPGADPEIADFLSGRQGEGGVFVLSLKTTGPQTTIEPSQAHNARLTMVHA
jgi:catechol 2,3-dioxygenase-like lactoylglutathione lyase family enzyme